LCNLRLLTIYLTTPPTTPTPPYTVAISDADSDQYRHQLHSDTVADRSPDNAVSDTVAQTFADRLPDKAVCDAVPDWTPDNTITDAVADAVTGRIPDNAVTDEVADRISDNTGIANTASSTVTAASTDSDQRLRRTKRLTAFILGHEL